MILQITSKLEIDVMQASELQPAVDLAVKYQMPALVVHGSLLADADLQRIKRRGKFKLIVPVDWPKGERQGMLKLRGMTIQEMDMDGFEVMLSGGRSRAELRHEAGQISNFLLDNVSQNIDLRFILGAQMRGEEAALDAAHALRGVRSTMLRTDHQLKLQVGRANSEVHGRLAAAIQEVNGARLKVSGNFGTAKAVVGCPWAYRVAVSLTQAQAILRDIERQPEALRAVLNREE